MKRLLTYARLQGKRTLRYAPLVLALILILCLSLGIALRTVVEANRSDGANKRLRIGVVGDMESDYLGFGLAALQSLDASRFSLELLAMTEEEAAGALMDGDLAGYLRIPEDFIDEAFYGRIGRLTFVAADNGIDMFGLFKEEVLRTVSCFLVESQNGVYGLENVMRLHGLSGRTHHMDAMTIEYLNLILNRTNVMDVTYLGVSDGLSFGGYMFSGLTVLLFLLCGIAYCPLMIRRDESMPRLLNAGGFCAFRQVAGEYLPFFLATLANAAILFPCLTLAVSGVGSAIPELADMTALGSLGLLLRFIPALLTIAALHFLLYELTDSVISGVLLQFIGSVGMGYVAGCFYPIGFFPAGIRALAACTPAGMARSYLSALINGESILLSLILLLVCTLVLLSVAVFARRRRIRAS